MVNQATQIWLHSLSSVLGALMSAGLTITRFREHEALAWQGLPSMVRRPDGLWKMPEGFPRLPLSYSLRARKGLERSNDVVPAKQVVKK